MTVVENVGIASSIQRKDRPDLPQELKESCLTHAAVRERNNLGMLYLIGISSLTGWLRAEKMSDVPLRASRLVFDCVPSQLKTLSFPVCSECLRDQSQHESAASAVAFRRMRRPVNNRSQSPPWPPEPNAQHGQRFCV
jgi:hypothetical protein